MRRPVSRRPALFALVALAIVLGAASCTPPAPVTITVEGQVLGYAVAPAGGIVVQTQGRTTVTDGAGRFTLTGVRTPYDLVLAAASGAQWIHVFEGLTSAEPRLDPWRAVGVGFSPATAPVSGTVLGGPLPAGRRVVLCLEADDVVVIGCTAVEPGGGAYSMDANWLAVGAVEARLRALRVVVDGNGLPTAYEGHVVVDVTLVPGVPLVQDLLLGPAPGVVPATVDIEVPAGTLASIAFISVRTSDRSMLRIAGPVTVAGPLSWPAPALGDGELTVLYGAQSPPNSAFGWAQGPADGLAPIRVGVAPQMLQPLAGATGVDGSTTFRVAAPAGEVITYRWTVVGGPRLARTTTRTEVTMPDPADAGFVVPAGADAWWNAIGHGTTTVEAAAALASDAALIVLVELGLHVALPASGAQARSWDDRTFVLAP